MKFKSAIYNIPGLGNSGPLHWQSAWERELGAIRIQQRDWEQPVCNEWTGVIDATLAPLHTGDVLLTAHSLGCCAAVKWAQEFKGVVKGMLLVAPADTERADFPEGTTGFAPMPVYKLPFPSIVLASEDDHDFLSIERAEYFAGLWGSKFVAVGKLGHINSASNLGLWETGMGYLSELDA